ncbi:hypothetical protein A3D78_05205 [Candidatus Gottesmanbacteria bacterium RIFCSPHIGHO2_02_FULL_39_14]|uniref:Transcriptional regulator n=1 Tax=Candidatus Gottesmanbacteria bacterium RIFCSPHIGHO2_02_FULL_39_14 TaxID=1798383 RepID=A0A1F5ZZP3_9BACT|nr:MAG: hypothetical protein A3D78_05205 [Candidatus Gottesmanbacteria bacterium RIFCSPHIGHO2_02_FULL_39_14]
MKNKKWRVPFVYLTKQFADLDRYLKAIKNVAKKGDFTLGERLNELEKKMARMMKARQAIGVANGTDALLLSLKVLDIKQGDEVITVPNSFIATTAVIALVGARPVFVDVGDDYLIDPDLIEKSITKRTKAIIPVHLAGNPCSMDRIMKIASEYKLSVIEDVAQAVFGKFNGKYLGTFGITGCFSFHPLKILNVWGDGGMIVTSDENLAGQLRLWRNHGLKTRDEVEFFAHNSRLDTIHAAILLEELKTLKKIINRRSKIAGIYDEMLRPLEPDLHIPERNQEEAKISPTFTQYVIQVKKRAKLIGYLTEKGIEVKVHYPIPIHLQKAAQYLGYRKGDFPVCEKQADTILTLPCHQYLTEKDVMYVSRQIADYYSK